MNRRTSSDLPLPCARLQSEDNRQYAYRVIRKSILNLELAPSRRLSEVELASWFQISRTPVHDAIVHIQREGLITSEPGHIAVVAVISESSCLDCLWILDIFCTDAISTFFTERVSRDQIQILRFILQHIFDSIHSKDGSETARFVYDYFQQFFTLGGRYSLIWTGMTRTYSDMYRLFVLIGRDQNQTSSLVLSLENMTASLEKRDSDAAVIHIRTFLSSIKALLPDIRQQYPEYFCPQAV